MFAKIRAEHGTLHICVNNAGLGHEATLLKGKTEHFRSMLEVSVNVFFIPSFKGPCI